MTGPRHAIAGDPKSPSARRWACCVSCIGVGEVRIDTKRQAGLFKSLRRNFLCTELGADSGVVTMQIRLNPSVIRHTPVALSWQVALFLILLIWPAGTAPKLNAEPLAPTTHYVAPGGDCGGAVPCYATIQAAVDAASDGERSRSHRERKEKRLQVAYINRAITLVGGYSTSDWDIAQPELYPTSD